MEKKERENAPPGQCGVTGAVALESSGRGEAATVVERATRVRSCWNFILKTRSAIDQCK